MSIPTIAVTCSAAAQDGPRIAGAIYQAKLDQTEYSDGFVVPEVTEAVADANGVAVLNLWPNALGVAGSSYRVTARDPATNKKFFDASVFVPNAPCNLHQIVQSAPFPPVDSAQQALIDVQALAADANRDAGIAAAAKEGLDEARQAAEGARDDATTQAEAAEAARALADGRAASAATAMLAAGQFAQVAADSALEALQSVDNAAAVAHTTATDTANALLTPALATVASTKAAIDGRYRGALIADPATRPDGTPNQIGDEYFYTGGTPKLLKRWSGATWQASDISTANLASDAGATLVVNKRAIANAAALTLAGWVESQTYCTADFASIVPGGVVDNQAALSTIIGLLPLGARLRIKGILRIAAPLSITRRVSLWCDGADDAILLDVGTGNDGITFTGPAAGLNGLDVHLNVYGRANACRNAVVLDRVDRSKIFLNVRAGATQYAAVYRGCLVNRFHLESTVNYSPPITSPGMQMDHMLVEKNTTLVVASNANRFYVNLEGARHGIVGTAQSNEGANTYEGTIEGLSGRPFDITNHYNLNIRNLWMEANATKSLFTDCKNIHIGPEVNCINSGDGVGTANEPDFVNCHGTVINGYAYGGANFDASCTGTRIGQVSASSASKFKGEGRGNCAESEGPFIASASPNQMYGGFGESTQENLFHNPFLDIWTLGAAANPDGLPPVNATSVQVTTPLYPRHGSRFSNRVTQTTAGSGNGAHIVPKAPYLTYTEDRWVSLAIAIYVATGQPEVRVFGIGGIVLDTVTAKDAWTVVRGSFKVTAGTPLEFWATCYNVGTSSYVTGEYFIGAVNIVNGSRVPKYFGDHGKRSEYVVTSVANAPSFVGQRALVAGKWYMAGGITSAADWLILN